MIILELVLKIFREQGLKHSLELRALMSHLFNGHTSKAYTYVGKHFLINISTVTISFATRPTLPMIALKER